MVGMSDKVIIVEATFDEDNENVPANIKFINTEEAVTEDFPVQELSDQSDVEAGIFNPGLDILLFLADDHFRRRSSRCHYWSRSPPPSVFYPKLAIFAITALALHCLALALLSISIA